MRKKDQLRLGLLAALLLALLAGPLGPAQAAEPQMETYTSYPIFLTQTVTPNIMIILDNSGSMNFNAYGTWPGNGGLVPDAPYACGEVNHRVVQARDDAEELTTDQSSWYNSADLDLGGYDTTSNNALVGLRFQNTGIPQGATIISAYIEFEAYASHSVATSVTIVGEASDDAPQFSGSSADISGRIATSASVAWNNIPAWSAGQTYQTPDLTAIVQEIVDRSGWDTDQGMVFRFSGTGKRDAKAYDYGDHTHAPVLHVTYEADCPKYYGYFDPEAKYTYSSNKFVRDANGEWDGNWLNWVSMRRIDVLRKVLMGGLATARTGGGNQTNYGEDPAQSSRTFVKRYNGSDVSPYHGDYYYGLAGGYIYVDDDSNPFSGYIARYNIAVQKDVANEPEDFYEGNLAGVLQRVGDRARWGNIWFDYGSGRNNSGGFVANRVGTNITTLITDLQNTGADTWTPLAETFYVAIQYFKQEDVESGLDYANNPTGPFNDTMDPYYEDQFIECAKSFVILLTDGASTKDAMIPSSLKNYRRSDLGEASTTCDSDSDGDCPYPSNGSDFLKDLALYARTNDLRPEGSPKALDGEQNIILYTIYAFGDDPNARDTLKAAARNGGFTDKNGNGLPDQQEEYDEDEDGVPDTYFEATDGYELQAQLLNAITDILRRASSGTAVSVLATSSEGEGTLVQAYFKPAVTVGTQDITWVGYLHGLWVDSLGRVREDTPPQGDKPGLDLTHDRIVDFFFDETTGQASFYRFELDEHGDRKKGFTDANGNGVLDEAEVYVDENGNGAYDAGEPLTDTNGNCIWDDHEPFTDANGNGTWDAAENFTDTNGNGVWDAAEEFTDTNGNGVYDAGETFTDANGNCVWDAGEAYVDEGNGVWDEAEPFVDANGNGVYDAGEDFTDLNGNGVWDDAEAFVDANGNGTWDDAEAFVDANGNGAYDAGEDFTDLGNGVYDPGEEFTDLNENGVWDAGEPFVDVGNGVWDEAEEFTDAGNGIYDQGEPFTDANGNCAWDEAEPLNDLNGNGVWDAAELYTDTNKNGAWDPAEDFTDENANGVWDQGEPYSDANENCQWDEGEEYWYIYTTHLLDELNPIWEAGSKLNQRPAVARTIKTFVDLDNDGTVGVGEFLEVDPANVASLKPFLGVKDGTAWSYLGSTHDDRASNLIKFICGELSGYTGSPSLRFRTINGEIWKLGDIVHSTPVSLGKPMDNYGLIYGDVSYQAYYTEYRERETMVYVGSNDGMLHAIYMGKYMVGDNPDTAGSTEKVYFDKETGTTADFGDELWAYIPQALLPHLKWLADPDYTHVYYVDLKPRLLDAQIFTDDETHPNGWGTVLLGGLNMGGKEISVTDDFPEGADTTRTFTSSYFALDVTDPHNPVLLWERSASPIPEDAAHCPTGDCHYPDLALTASYPTVAKVGDSWFAIFGSGPTEYDGTSDQPGRVYVVDLATGKLRQDFTTGENSAFMGAPITVDVGLNYNVDVGYIGETYQQGANWLGKMYRLRVPKTTGDWRTPSFTDEYDDDPTNWSFEEMFAADGPVTAAPTASIDSENNLWVYFGTGRYYSEADKLDTSIQYMYGTKDPYYNSNYTTQTSALNKSPTDFDLLDAGGVEVYTDGTVSGVGGGTETWAELVTLMDSKDGWSFSLDEAGERILNKPTMLGGIVLTTSFVPNQDPCGFGGSSNLWGVYFETGTSYTEAVFEGGSQEVQVGGETKTKTAKKTEMGIGRGSSVTIHVGKQEGATGYVQQSTGIVEEVALNPAFDVRSGFIYWRER